MAGATGVKDVWVGDSQTFILKEDGTVWACGMNNSSCLGLLDSTDRNIPTKVTSNNVKSVSSSAGSTFFMKNDGTFWGWGQNAFGQLGLGHKNTPILIPTQIPIDNVKNIYTGGYDTIIEKNDDTFWGWGYNIYGKLGLGHRNEVLAPTQIPINDVQSFYAGHDCVLFLKNDGTVWGCGVNNYGQLGLGDKVGCNTPTKLNISNVKSVACGGGYNIIEKNDGTVWGCGDNGYGQLGLGHKNTPILIFTKIPIVDVKSVSCGSASTVAIKNDGTAWGWGNNILGQLGLGHKNDTPKPTQIAITGVKSSRAGTFHTLFLKNDGTVWGCGQNTYGQLGLGHKNSPVLIPTQMQWQPKYFLFRDGGVYKTVKEDGLHTLAETVLTKALFESEGFGSASHGGQYQKQLGETFDIVSYNSVAYDQAMVVSHLPHPQLMVFKEPIALPEGFGISGVALTIAGTTGMAKVVLSFDDGGSWQTFLDGAWAEIALDKDIIKAKGLTASALNGITKDQWQEMSGQRVNFAFYLEKSAVNNDLAVDSLTITVNRRSHWERAEHEVDYDYGYPSSKTLLVKLLKDGSYKMNYADIG